MSLTRLRTPLIAAGLIGIGLLLPVLLSDFALQLMALFLPFTLLALSIDLLWGENRLISFGQGAFFAGGGYIGALILLGRPYDVVGGAASFLETGTDEPFAERLLSGLQSIAVAGMPLPALVLPPLLMGAAGLLIGIIIFRVTSPEVYLPLVTLGVGVVAGIWFNEIKELGATNGLGGVPPFTAEIADPSEPVGGYLFNLAFVVAAFAGYWWFRRSRIGWTWRALGDDAVRLEALGYPVRRLRAYGFAASTALAGLAGALYAATAGFVGPSLAGVGFSAQALIWVAVGGVGTLLGPLVGTLTVKWGEQWLSSELGLQESWQLFLGLVLILIVLVAPGGICGSFSRGRGPARRRPLERPPALSAPASPPQESPPQPALSRGSGP